MPKDLDVPEEFEAVFKYGRCTTGLRSRDRWLPDDFFENDTLTELTRLEGMQAVAETVANLQGRGIKIKAATLRLLRRLGIATSDRSAPKIGI
jgi:hypothetical protein